MLKEVYTRFPKPIPNEKTVRTYLEKTRKILAKTEGNPRYLNIHLHTFRHYKATMLYHQTRDLLYVQQTLGHKSISNTLRYTQLVDWKDTDQFVCKAAKTLDEASKLIETGFDYVTELDMSNSSGSESSLTRYQCYTCVVWFNSWQELIPHRKTAHSRNWLFTRLEWLILRGFGWRPSG